jgi:hypothetical protein
MTVLTMPAQPAQDSTLRPVPWRRMAWVTWRQHRPTLITVPALLGAVAVFLWIAGLKIRHDYAAMAGCPPLGSAAFQSSASCVSMNSAFNSTDWTIGNTVGTFMTLAPALIGAFAGAPVLARELETGTFRYAWTQGIGRKRWTIAKLVLLAIAITAAAEAFSQVFTWFFQPFLPEEQLTVLDASVFVTRGIAFAAWTLAAFATGAFLGMLLRRIIPAMAATLGAYLGLDLLAWLVLRPHYPVALVSSNPGIDNLSSVNGPWVLSTWFTGSGGKPVSQSTIVQITQHLPANGGHGRFAVARALVQHGYTEWTRYIPVSRFWPMQFIEAGWLLALSVLLIAATVWLVRHRAA